MVSDAGGFDDKSFNQSGFEGLTQAAEELGIEVATSSPPPTPTTRRTSTASSPRTAT